MAPLNLIPRKMQTAIREAFDSFPVITLCGPRQSGKTTLCRTEFPSLPYVNLEDFTTRQFATEDPKGFLLQYGGGAIIDEVQLVPSLFGQIQVIVDEDRFSGNDGRKFILTGSSNFAHHPDLRQSLAGRTGIFTLLPLSTSELLEGGYDLPSVEDVIVAGGYPGVWTRGQAQRRQIIESYIDTYVERDVRRLMEVKDLHKFSTFIRLCASRIGTELNKSSLAVEVGVSVPTVESWLSVLEASFVIYLLPPWFANIGKRLVKSPKLYFCDTGVASNLLGINEAIQLVGHPSRGAMFENLVINNVLKFGYNRGIKEILSFYRDKTGREIDLIRETDGIIEAFEMKAGMTYHQDYFRHIAYLQGILGDRLGRTGVVYTGDVEMIRPKDAVINYKKFPDNFKVQL